MEKSMSTPKKHHILILSSLSIHFSSFPLLIAAVEEVPEEGEGAEERERSLNWEKGWRWERGSYLSSGRYIRCHLLKRSLVT